MLVYIILNCIIILHITHIFFLMDLKKAIKQLRRLFVHHLSSQNVYLTRRQFFTAEVDAIVSVLCYIKNRYLLLREIICYFSNSKSALQSLLWDFLVFPST